MSAQKKPPGTPGGHTVRATLRSSSWEQKLYRVSTRCRKQELGNEGRKSEQMSWRDAKDGLMSLVDLVMRRESTESGSLLSTAANLRVMKMLSMISKVISHPLTKVSPQFSSRLLRPSRIIRCMSTSVPCAATEIPRSSS